MRQADRGDGRPRCYDVELAELVTHQDGHMDMTMRGVVDGRPINTRVPVMVTRAFPMTRECRSWVSTPGTESVPFTESWNCAGCCRYPKDLVEQQQHRFLNRHRGREPHPPQTSGG
jgi:hypothetical protein